MERSTKFWIIVGIIFYIVSLIYTIKEYFIDSENDKNKFYNGIIINKESHDQHNKHGGYYGTRQLLIVNFESIGVKSVNVNTETYYTNNIGDRVSFGYSYNDLHNTFNIIPFIIKVLTIFTTIILVLVLIFYGVSKFNEYLDR
jgi:hypothetical protein